MRFLSKIKDMEILDQKISQIRKIDKRRQSALKKLGLETGRDLIWYFPVRYQDFSKITDIKDLRTGEVATIRGRVEMINVSRSPRKRILVTEMLIKDQTGTVRAIWFNQRFIADSLPKGSLVFLSGKVEFSRIGLQFISPEFEKFKGEQTHVGRIAPVYALSGVLTSKWLRFIIKNLLPRAVREIADYLPDELRKRNQLIDLAQSIKQIHFPVSENLLKQARRRLAFDELFIIQLYNLSQKNAWQKQKAAPLLFQKKLIQDFVSSLPFVLTPTQKKSAWEILRGLESNKPMNRLLEGDVGSGKTIVALMAVLQAVANGYQAVMLAPTEILASQHFVSAEKFLDEKIKIGLFTRTQKEINGYEKITAHELGEKMAAGKVDFVISTHAILQDKVKFKNLALAIVDEQHRFGVAQRAALKIKTAKFAPHLLSMTATPIPRTLALALYSDLDLSLIPELPKGRKKIITEIVPAEKRLRAYDFIRQQIKDGRQAFVICPLIKESDKLGVRSVKVEFEKLKHDVFPELAIDFLHGRMKKEEKQQKMKKFLQNQTKVLVSTSVVEVGIDVPNASVMMIEGADRFGLAQLHQFRGRVGRSVHQSYCLVFTDSDSEKTLQRLQALQESENGFDLAEKDLELRGPGEVFGVRQSGFPDLKTASLSDHALIALTRNEAEAILQNDPSLSRYPGLKEKINNFSQIVHLE